MTKPKQNLGIKEYTNARRKVYIGLLMICCEQYEVWGPWLWLNAYFILLHVGKTRSFCVKCINLSDTRAGKEKKSGP